MSDLFACLEFFWKLEAAREIPFRLNGFDDSREADVGVDLVSQLSGQAKEWRADLIGGCTGKVVSGKCGEWQWTYTSDMAVLSSSAVDGVAILRVWGGI